MDSTLDLIRLRAKLESRMEIIPWSGCWIWMGNTVPPYGYGQVDVGNGVKRYAHRLSWMIHRGPIPDGLRVCHHCDVHCCFNPHHLFLGTDAMNTADLVAKGRHAHGVKHPLAKLTDEGVFEICSSNRPYSYLSSKYGVSKALICMIRSGKRWPHIKKKYDELSQ